MFFDFRGIIHKEFVPPGQRMNVEYYKAVLDNLPKRNGTHQAETLQMRWLVSLCTAMLLLIMLLWFTSFYFKKDCPSPIPYSPDLVPLTIFCSLSREYTSTEASRAPNEATLACCVTPQCDLPWNKNVNVLMRGMACSQLIWLVRRSPWLVLILMDWQPMAQVAQRMRQTESICARQNWPYTLAHCSVLRLFHSVCGLPRCKRIPGFILESKLKGFCFDDIVGIQKNVNEELKSIMEEEYSHAVKMITYMDRQVYCKYHGMIQCYKQLSHISVRLCSNFLHFVFQTALVTRWC